MYPVFMAQWMKDKRKPYIILLFIGLSIIATLIFGDIDRIEQTTAMVYSTEPNAEAVEEKWLEGLNGHETIDFIISDKEEAHEQVAEGAIDVAIHLMENDYRLITSSDMPNIQIVEQYVHKVFTEEAQLEAAAGDGNTEKLRSELDSYLENPPIQVQTESIDGGEIPNYDMGMQLLFGFTLFIAMFTIGFKVNGISGDKVSGIWNRLILSPVSKTNMYIGHLLYSFCVGFLQMLIVFLIFHYVMGYDLGNLSMILVITAVFTLSMVSVAMLITGIVKTPEQFNMVYPSLIPMIPVISGVYMLPGTISNPVLQFIGDMFPLSHGVEAMTDVALFDAGWNDIALPIALMLLIGVFSMGIGINMVERRK
ncbi:ABC transporter permease [Oceanobacillus halophilus]|uniref:ABC transporter permease n=1 Tax=Oceanobacillus halophilus TaxID=930130 RepID=A0A495A4U3_9BACI|nr:ABC transporter permease [Oceanobacillus halophilus]RKQ34573.1 ABC transporter permease [Oceanobacillus halophilus]